MWPVMRSLYLNIDGADRISGIMTVLAIIVNNRQLFRGPATMKIWILWVAYSLVNLMIKGYTNDYPFIWWSLANLICPLVSMLVIYNSILYNDDKFLKKIVYFYLFYVLCGVLNLEVDDVSDRMGNAMGNSYLNESIFFMPFILLYNKSKKIPAFLVFMFVAYIFLIIIMSGQRKALVGLFIMVVGMLLAEIYRKSNNVKIGSLLMIFCVFAVASYGAMFLMDNTLAGERFSKQFENTDYDYNIFLTLMGDRAFMYVDGLIEFLEHPLTGIGLTNFTNSRLNPMGFMLHTEYMTELAEGGVVGSSMFLMFYIGMIVRLIKMFRSNRATYETFILGFALIAVLEINFFAWTYSYRYYFMLFGLIYAIYDKIIEAQLVKKSNEGN